MPLPVRGTIYVALSLLLVLSLSCSDEAADSDSGPNDVGDVGHGSADTFTGADIEVQDTSPPEDTSTPPEDVGGIDADTIDEPETPAARGLFLSQELWERSQQRITDGEEPFATSYSIQRGRANSSLEREANPFAMNVQEITFGWCGSAGEDTLAEATGRLEQESDWMRTLALEFALTGEEEYGEKATEMMVAWAEDHTEVNMYDFNPDFSSASIDGQTDGFCSDRPWNFVLDGMWQAYGLINAADAYLLLTRSGFELSSEEDDAIRDWLLRLTEAVNSSFHGWTRWADHHPNAGSYERYRSDNHLSWSLAGLLAAAAALGDEDLAHYVLHGGEWTDRRAGAYENPSYVRDVIRRAIEGDEEGERGRFYEEKILRDPPVGYSLFHLWALVLVAQIAELHFDDDLWTFTADGSGSIRDAYDRYVDFVLGERESPEPSQDGDMTSRSWHFEVALHKWEDPRYRQAVEQLDRHRFIVQSWGPLSLIFGE